MYLIGGYGKGGYGCVVEVDEDDVMTNEGHV